MVCPECGQSVSNDVKICPHCGHVLRVSGLRVRRPMSGDDMATAKRDALTPTHPRLSQVPAAAIIADTTDPWQNEWMGTAKRPLSPAATATRAPRRYLLPAVVAAIFLVACVGIALVLHSAASGMHSAPASVPISATSTSAPTATISATSTSAPTATVAAYGPPHHAPTATARPTLIPSATATAPIIIVTTTANPVPTATTGAGTKTPTPKPAGTP